MVLGQSAAPAACLAIDGRTSVQKVPYDTLRTRLLADGQVIEAPLRGVCTSVPAKSTQAVLPHQRVGFLDQLFRLLLAGLVGFPMIHVELGKLE